MHSSRRSFLSSAVGLAVMTAVASTAASQSEPTKSAAVEEGKGGTPTEVFTARSGDGTLLVGEAYGDPSAPEILFIHGLRQSRLSWEKQLSDPALKEFRIVTFDLRGHGDSDKPKPLEAYSDADRWADDVAAVIDAAKLRRPVLVGWSLGGYVAGAYLRKYGGGKIAGINLVDAVTKLSADLFTKETVDFIGPTISHDLSVRTAATADFLLACFHRQPANAEMQRMMVINGMTSREVYEGFVQTKTTDLIGVFAAFDGPILLTHGVNDRLVRVAMSEQVKASHSRSRISLYASSGHSPFYEEPHKFGRELAEFVKTL